MTTTPKRDQVLTIQAGISGAHSPTGSGGLALADFGKLQSELLVLVSKATGTGAQTLQGPALYGRIEGAWYKLDDLNGGSDIAVDADDGFVRRVLRPQGCDMIDVKCTGVAGAGTIDVKATQFVED